MRNTQALAHSSAWRQQAGGGGKQAEAPERVAAAVAAVACVMRGSQGPASRLEVAGSRPLPPLTRSLGLTTRGLKRSLPNAQCAVGHTRGWGHSVAPLPRLSL